MRCAEALQAYFGRFGDISECMIMRDPVTRRSRYLSLRGTVVTVFYKTYVYWMISIPFLPALLGIPPDPRSGTAYLLGSTTMLGRIQASNTI